MGKRQETEGHDMITTRKKMSTKGTIQKSTFMMSRASSSVDRHPEADCYSRHRNPVRGIHSPTTTPF